MRRNPVNCVHVLWPNNGRNNNIKVTHTHNTSEHSLKLSDLIKLYQSTATLLWHPVTDSRPQFAEQHHLTAEPQTFSQTSSPALSQLSCASYWHVLHQFQFSF